MRIALIVPGGVDRSGELRVIPALLALIRRLAAHHAVHVFALRQEPRPASWELCGARIHNIGLGWTRARALRAIRAEHHAARFDLVQSIWSGACGLIAVTAARALRLPGLVHVTGGEPVALRDIGFGGRIHWRGRLQEAVVLRCATMVTATSTPVVRMLAELGREAQRVPLGVDLTEWRPRQPVRRDPSVPARLIHVATLNRVKDQPMLLRALAALARAGTPFQMDVVGEDTLAGETQRLAASLGLADRVCFHGFLPQRSLMPLVQAAHLMVLSSRHEAGPFAMLEAAALGVPTVGTAVGHLAEWSPGAAISVPVGDSAALAGALQAILADEEWRLRVARKARQRAMDEDADCTARLFETLYADLLRLRG
jgi:glycosyltransferase involved in cell wall biosynthesis